MYYNKSIKKMLKFLIEAETPVDPNAKPDPNAKTDPNTQPDIAATALPPPIGGAGVVPGAPPPPNSSRVTKIQINPDPSKDDGGILAKFKANRSSTTPTKSATTPVVPNKEEEDSKKDETEDATEGKPTTEPKEEENVDKKAQFSKRVEKHIKDINGKNKDSSINKHERKNKQDKRYKEFTGDIERSHKKAIGKGVNKDYYKKLDKKLGY